jgi:hypothetical protein
MATAAQCQMWADQLIEIADAKIDDEHDQDRNIRVRQWLLAKRMPHRYGNKAEG